MNRYTPYKYTALSMKTWYKVWDEQEKCFLKCVDGLEWGGSKKQAENVCKVGNEVFSKHKGEE